MDALSSKGIFASTGLSSFRIWCPTVEISSNSRCYDDVLPTRAFYDDAMSNFLNSSEHRFDSTGSIYVQNMISTYPNPSYSIQKCGQYDQSKKNALPVETIWTFSGEPANTQRNRVCGYINGALSNAFLNDASLASGSKSVFEDVQTVAVAGYKRIYW